MSHTSAGPHRGQALHGIEGHDPLDANDAAHDIALRDKPRVAPQSIGEGPDRRVVVLPRNA